MMGKRIKVVLLAALLGTSILGCSDGANTAEKKDSADTSAAIKAGEPAGELPTNTDLAVIATLRTVADTLFAGERDTIITVTNGSALVVGHLTANTVRPTYTLIAKKGQTITATIRPSKKGGNARINQIQQPDGAFDGPFGDSLSYTFKRNGKLRLIIGENMMAGDPYTGDFILRILLAETANR
jgi:hypothetical protein